MIGEGLSGIGKTRPRAKICSHKPGAKGQYRDIFPSVVMALQGGIAAMIGRRDHKIAGREL